LDCGQSSLVANLYFSSFLLLATYVFLNLFVAVVIDNFTFLYSLQDAATMRSIGLSEEDLKRFIKVWDLFDPTCTGYLEVFPRDRASPFCRQIGTPLAMEAPIPDYWMSSLIATLRRAAEKGPDEVHRISVVDFLMVLVTRVMGTDAMSEEDAHEFLEALRKEGSSQLGCIARDIVIGGQLQQVKGRYIELMKTRAVEEREKRIREEIDARRRPTMEEQMRMVLEATQLVLDKVAPDAEAPIKSEITNVIKDADLRETMDDVPAAWYKRGTIPDPPTIAEVQAAAIPPEAQGMSRPGSPPSARSPALPALAKSEGPRGNPPAAVVAEEPTAVQPVSAPATTPAAAPAAPRVDSSPVAATKIDQAPLGSGWKLDDAKTKKTMESYFSRYDLDESGVIDNAEELHGLVTNLCVKLKCRVSQVELSAVCDAYDSEASPMTFPIFFQWFQNKFQAPRQ